MRSTSLIDGRVASKASGIFISSTARRLTTCSSVARLILLFLQTEAIRTSSPEVVLGRSLNRWIERMDLTPGGKTRQLVTEQARRISACRLTFFTDKVGGGELRSNGAFVRDAISLAGVIDEAQPALWQDRVRLDDGFWKSLREHPVPVREEAIRANRPPSPRLRYALPRPGADSPRPHDSCRTV